MGWVSARVPDFDLWPQGVVPYLGTFLKDLVMLDAASKDELEVSGVFSGMLEPGGQGQTGLLPGRCSCMSTEATPGLGPECQGSGSVALVSCVALCPSDLQMGN